MNNHNQHPIKSINIQQNSSTLSIIFKIPTKRKRIQNKVDQILHKYNTQQSNKNSSKSINLQSIDNDIQSIDNNDVILNIKIYKKQISMQKVKTAPGTTIIKTHQLRHNQ